MPYRKFIDRDFPHIVETVVPERGLRSKRVAIMDFHAPRGIKPYPSERHNDDCQYIRWHFADREIAEAFAAKFAKERTNVPL
jgi:hypothetical protein